MYVDSLSDVCGLAVRISWATSVLSYALKAKVYCEISIGPLMYQ